MGASSNDLRAVLKAEVLKFQAGLDISKSIENIKKDITTINSKLASENKKIKLGVELIASISDLKSDITKIQTLVKDNNSLKNIKLNVELDAKISDLQTDLKNIQKKLTDSKTPSIKMDFEINTTGSVVKIKNQLKEIQTVIEKFNAEYGQTLSKIKQQSNDMVDGMFSPKMTSTMKSGIEQIRKTMASGFGDGLFSTKQVTDAEGNLKSLVATMQKANGEMQSISHSWSDDDGAWMPITVADVNKTEANTEKAKKALLSLYDTINKLDNTKTKTGLLSQFDELSKVDALTSEAVNDLSRLATEERTYQAVLAKREDVLNNIERKMREIDPLTKTYGNMASLGEASGYANTVDELERINKTVKELSTAYVEQDNVMRKRIMMLHEIELAINKVDEAQLKMVKTEQNDHSAGMASSYAKQALAIAEKATSVRELRNAQELLLEVDTRLSEVDKENTAVKTKEQMDKATESVKLLINELGRLEDKTDAEISTELEQLNKTAKEGLKPIQDLGVAYKQNIDKAKDAVKELNKSLTLISKEEQDLGKRNIQSGIVGAVSTSDINALKSYIGELKEGKVETLAMQSATDEYGRAVTRMKVTMQGTGKTVQQYTIDLDKANNSVKQVAESSVYNANRNLGVFEQLKIAMARVPVWTVAMTSFYSVVRGVKFVMSELTETNTQMTDLARVAGENLNVDSMLASSVTQSKQLGANIHEVLDSLGEATRTFGEFNEQSLLAVNRTAIMMDNVSDLSLGDSMSSLIGTMNAFNITAEDSIHIVDSFNEVDNNFAISTQQIATAMSKTGSTAKTFGLEMEQVVGHITAIGSVTMESGERIGNSLKTIYSRITTLPEAGDILESVGVAIQSIGENGETYVRPVNDILSDLSQNWYELTDAERQNIGVTVAGRNQLSRFLALMNNWNTSVDATTTAYNSQGSALREQEAYMQSYDAKLNQLKTQFTELALAIGDAFLSDSMFMAIESIGKLIASVVKLVDKIGVLPTLLGGVGIALKVFGVTDKIGATLGATINGVSGFFSLLKLDLADLSKTGTSTFSALTQAVFNYGAGMKGASATVQVLSKVITSIGTGLALAGIGIAIGFIIERIIKVKKEAEEAQKAFEKLKADAIDSYNAMGNDIDGLINRYEELNNKMKDNTISTEEMTEYTGLVEKLSKILPNAVDHVDANGEAHLKSANAIREESKWVKELALSQEALIRQDADKAIGKQSKEYEKLTDKIKKLKTEMDNIDSATADAKADPYGDIRVKMDKMAVQQSGVQIENKAKLNALEAEYSVLLGDSVKLVQENSDQILISSGNMENMTDSGKSLVDKFIEINRNKIDIKDSKKTMEELQDNAVALGSSINKAYADLTEGLEGAELEKVTTQLDAMANVLPEDFLMMPNGGNGANSVKANVETIFGMVGQIKDGGGNFQGLIDSLIAVGVDSNTAKNFVIDLGNEFDNQAIKTAVAEEELTAFNEELRDTKDAVLEAINPLETLFGLGSGDLGKIQSHIQTLSLLKSTYGDLFAESPKAKASADALSSYFGTSSDYILGNVDSLGLLGAELDKAQPKTDAYGKTYLTYGTYVNEAGEEVEKTSNEMIDSLLESIGVMGGLSSGWQLETGVVSRATEEMSTRIQEAFGAFQQNPKEWNKYFTTVQEQLNSLDGDITTFTDTNGRLRLQMADGSPSGYLDTLNEQLGTMNMKVVESADGSQILFEYLDNGARVVSKVSEEARNGTKAVSGLTDSFTAFRDNQNEETQSAYIETLKQQIFSFGSDLKVVTDETTGALKLEMADGSSSVWLDTLNGQLDGTTGKLEQVPDGAGNIRDALNIGNGNYIFFDEVKNQSDESKASVEGINTAISELYSPENAGGAKVVNVDASGAQTEVDNLASSIGIVNSLGIAPKLLPSANTELAGAVTQITAVKTQSDELYTNVNKVQSAVTNIGTDVDTVLNNTIGIQGVATIIQTLRDNIGLARADLGLLFADASAKNPDVGGLTAIASTAEGVAGSINSLALVATASKENLTIMTVSYMNTSQTIQKIVVSMCQSISTSYINIIRELNGRTGDLSGLLSNGFNGINSMIIAKMNTITNNMSTIFNNGINQMVASASSLPDRIGRGITANMSSATNSMQSLADGMVDKFKTALGIHSPSKVFTELGGHVIDGLVNGLSGSNLSSLGESVFSDFGGGVFSSLDSIKSFLTGDFMGEAGAGVQQWAGLATKALTMTGQYSESNLQKLLYQMQTESGGNAQAINLWDSNAMAGIPSKGLMQVIDPTFQAYAMDGYDSNIYDPLSNMLASIKYALSRYGSLSNAFKGVGYANGGIVEDKELAWHGEEGAEVIIPLIKKRRKRGLDLWMDAGARLGINPNMLKSLTSLGGAFNSVSSSFSMASGDGGEGGGAEGSSGTGIFSPSINDISRVIGVENTFSATEGLERLYEPDMLQNNLDFTKVQISRATTELDALVQKSLDYRNVLTEINYQENKTTDLLNKQLDQQKGIHKWIARRLTELGDVSSHTEEQRKEYNELQKTWEDSYTKIANIENQIREMGISIKERSLEIFTNYIDEILGKYEEALARTAEKIDNVDYNLEILSLTDSENTVDKMALQAEKIAYLLGQEITVQNKQADLNEAYNVATRTYGLQSDQALKAREELLSVENELQDATIERISLENDYEDARRQSAENGIDSLKEYYTQTKAMTTDAIELEKEQLESLHNDKMDMYDAEIDRINSVYDAKIDSMDAQKQEEEYLTDLNIKNQERAELMNKISILSRDTSLEGRKELADLQAQLTTVNEEMSSLQTSRQEELFKQAIEAQKQQQISAVEAEKETVTAQYDVQTQGLDEQVKQATEAYDSMINDSAKWQSLSDEFVSGNTSPLMAMIEAMQTQMASYMSGDFSMISSNFGSLSQSTQQEFANDKLLDVSNLLFDTVKSLESISDMSTVNASSFIPAGMYDSQNPDLTTWYGEIFRSTVNTNSGEYAYNPSSQPSQYQASPENRTHAVENGDTLWDLAQEYYGNPYKWTTIMEANPDVDPKWLNVGKRLIIPFESGGFTGDWSGNDGRIAMLHKKELVLNAQQTSDILNTVKLLDGLKMSLPKISVPQNAIAGGQGVVIQNMELSFPDFKGTKENAKTMIDEFVTRLKKR